MFSPAKASLFHAGNNHAHAPIWLAVEATLVACARLAWLFSSQHKTTANGIQVKADDVPKFPFKFWIRKVKGAGGWFQIIGAQMRWTLVADVFGHRPATRAFGGRADAPHRP
jgi:hypothetical protein